MPLGAGFAPAGLSPAGFGAPDAAPVMDNTVLPDVRTGLPQAGRMINPVTKDYVFTPDGRVQGFGSVAQRVQLALTTLFNSSAVAGLGLDLSGAGEKGPDFQRKVATAVTNALASLVKQQLVAIVSVQVQDIPINPDGAWCLVQWRDLTTGLQQQTPLFS